MFKSRKICKDLKIGESKLSIISQQCVVYNCKCDLSDAEYVGFSFDKAYRDAWWVTRIEIRVLKGLCNFEMGLHFKNRFLVESNTFVHFRVHRM